MYLQEENQRIRLVNESLNGNSSPVNNPPADPKTCSSSENNSARVIVLENENVTNKINIVELRFNNKLQLLKMEFENKISDIELKSKQNFHPSRKENQDIKTLLSKHDDLNNRMRKLERAFDEVIENKENSEPKAQHVDTFRIPFTPVQKKVNLPYQTPANLHKSLSDEIEICSSPDDSFFHPSGSTPSKTTIPKVQKTFEKKSQLSRSNSFQPAAIKPDFTKPPPGYSNPIQEEALLVETSTMEEINLDEQPHATQSFLEKGHQRHLSF